MIVDEIMEGLSDRGAKRLRQDFAMGKATVVRIQNVADYMMFGTDQEVFGPADFPHCRPPWNNTWWEWRNPVISRSSVHGVLRQPIAACAIQTTVFEDERQDGVIVVGDVFCRTAGIEDAFLGSIIRVIDKDGSLIVGGRVKERNHRLIKSVSIFLEREIDDPQVKLEATNPSSAGCFFISNSPHETMAYTDALVVALKKVMWMAMSFAHCKNVEVRVDSVAPALQRKRERVSHMPVTRVTTLDIDPIKKVIRDIRAQGSNISHASALHMVRGHFKTYTKERPLLGRTTGTFFWHQQLRGSKDSGEVIKDYNIKH